MSESTPPPGRVLGLDIGDATFGVAVSDETRLIASAVTTLRRAAWATDLSALRALLAEHEAVAIVVGIPRKLDGRETDQTRKTERVAAALEKDLGLPVHRTNEVLTTAAAKRTLLEAGTRNQKRSGALDQVAATLILQGWLDTERARASFLASFAADAD
ncbi:Holliday junction resolvase RuvX [Myxococcota bacterium]|nr:Holliday junction resolvase RuvX [Myxococcota bacterium]